MESLVDPSVSLSRTQERFREIHDWLSLQCPVRHIIAMPGDASTRRYFRIYSEQTSFVLMDAGSDDLTSFIAIAHALRNLGVQTPHILAMELKKGLLLLSDFGNHTYAKILNPKNAHSLYLLALKTLSQLQQCKEVPGWKLPFFHQQWMLQEWAWHKEWFLNGLLSLSNPPSELDATFQCVVNSAVEQPQVFMHRDYHSANLMFLGDVDQINIQEFTSQAIGVLDFQDAFIGPITYDLVSLIRDCYVTWSYEQQQDWLKFYWQTNKQQNRNDMQDISFSQFLTWFDWMGIERHLKALFTFSRKQLRDGNANYLKHIPNTLNYIIEVSALYPQLTLLHDYYHDVVKPRMLETLSCVP